MRLSRLFAQSHRWASHKSYHNINDTSSHNFAWFKKTKFTEYSFFLELFPIHQVTVRKTWWTLTQCRSSNPSERDMRVALWKEMTFFFYCIPHLKSTDILFSLLISIFTKSEEICSHYSIPGIPSEIRHSLFEQRSLPTNICSRFSHILMQRETSEFTRHVLIPNIRIQLDSISTIFSWSGFKIP